MKRTLFLSLIVVFILSACKKKNEEVIISLQSKWIAESDVYNEYDNAALTYSFTYPYEKTTFDFQKNNHLLITDEFGNETYPYTIQNGTTVTFDGYTYEIKNLTAKSVVLYYREEYAPGSYVEYIINLKK